ncbi:hypothetical protein H4582DRAFT_2084324 [Lactarius indigo]|nr:hypothetical protein H4582DRAFT_2084324 [Lactarius indigo]
MSEINVLQFLDILAVVDSDEEEDFDDEQLHEDIGSGSESPRSLTPSFSREASELQALVTSRSSRAPRYNNDPAAVPQHFRVPTQGDPDIWSVRVKPDFESGLAWQIGPRVITGDAFHRPCIAAVFSRPGIPGYIFIEGSLSDVTAAVQGPVCNARPRLVPANQRVMLLSPCNPLSRRIHEGKWPQEDVERAQDIGHFMGASYIRNPLSFAPWAHQFAQGTLEPRQRVKVESRDHSGAIGYIHDVTGSVATVDLDLSAMGIPMLQVPLRALALYCIEGDHIKLRRSDSCGIVMSVDKVSKKFIYVDKGSQLTVIKLLYAVEPYNPPPNFYLFTAGTWVDFDVLEKPERPKRRG